jgi:hypothetical protein
VRHAHRSVGDRRTDILGRKMRIILQQLAIGPPSASLLRISSTVIRVPRITGLLSITAGLISIRSVVTAISSNRNDTACQSLRATRPIYALLTAVWLS